MMPVSHVSLYRSTRLTWADATQSPNNAMNWNGTPDA